MRTPDIAKTIHESVLEDLDHKIRLLERDLAKLHEERREYINRNNLNKA